MRQPRQRGMRGWRFESNKENDRQQLASVLSNLGSQLSEVGRFEEGLRADEEAEGLWRGLVEKQPDCLHRRLGGIAGAISGTASARSGGSRTRSRLPQKVEGLLARASEKAARWVHRQTGGDRSPISATYFGKVGRFEDARSWLPKRRRPLRRGWQRRSPMPTQQTGRDRSAIPCPFRQVGRFEDALKAAEKVESLWRGLAGNQPNAYNRRLGDIVHQSRQRTPQRRAVQGGAQKLPNGGGALERTSREATRCTHRRLGVIAWQSQQPTPRGRAI